MLPSFFIYSKYSRQVIKYHSQLYKYKDNESIDFLDSINSDISFLKKLRNISVL